MSALINSASVAVVLLCLAGRVSSTEKASAEPLSVQIKCLTEESWVLLSLSTLSEDGASNGELRVESSDFVKEYYGSRKLPPAFFVVEQKVSVEPEAARLALDSILVTALRGSRRGSTGMHAASCTLLLTLDGGEEIAVSLDAIGQQLRSEVFGVMYSALGSTSEGIERQLERRLKVLMP